MDKKFLSKTKKTAKPYILIKFWESFKSCLASKTAYSETFKIKEKYKVIL